MVEKRTERVGLKLAGLLAGLTFVFMLPVLWPPAGEALGSLDMRGLFIPWWTTAREAVWNGRLPLWDADHFGGYPFLSNPQVALFYPFTWLVLLLPVQIGVSWYVAVHVWLAGVGMLYLTRYTGSHWTGSMLAAVTFGFSGFMTTRIWAGHVGLLATHSWVPWLLLATLWSVRNPHWWTAVLAALPFALAILAGHTTSLLYVGLIWFLFTLYVGLDRKRWLLLVRQVGIAGVFGLVLASVQLLPLAEFSQFSARASAPSFEFASAYSLPPAHLLTFLVPEFFGEPIRAGYWSVPNFEELTYYAGTLVLLGLVLVLRKPSRLATYYGGITILGLLLALGSYGFLYRWFYTVLPPFRLARAPGRAAFLMTFGLAALLAEGLSIWERQPEAWRREQLHKWVRPFVWTTAVVGITVIAAIGAVFAAQHPTDTSGRLWHQIGGWSSATLLLLLGSWLLWRYLAQPSRSVAVALVALVVADLWLFGFKFLQLESTAPPPMWREAKAVIGEAEGRVLPWGISIFDQNGASQVGLTTIFGYNALEVATNVALAASVPDPRSSAYDVLGVRYVMATAPQDRYVEGERPLHLLDRSNGVWVYERERVLPLARLVTQVEVIPDEKQAIARIHEPDFDPTTTVILEEAPACESIGTAGTATVLTQSDGYWHIGTESEEAALLVLSETAYPGWQVLVDGETAVWHTAYTTLRAVCVPAGTHEVEWLFKPTIFKWGGGITTLGLLLVGLALVQLRRHEGEWV